MSTTYLDSIKSTFDLFYTVASTRNGEITFKRGMNSKVMQLFAVVFGKECMDIDKFDTEPDVVIIGGIQYDIVLFACYYNEIKLKCAPSIEVSITTYGAESINFDSRIFITEMKKRYDHATLIWLPSYEIVESLFFELDLFDEQNLIYVILSYLTLKK